MRKNKSPDGTYLKVVAEYSIYPAVVCRTPLGFPVEPLGTETDGCEQENCVHI